MGDMMKPFLLTVLCLGITEVKNNKILLNRSLYLKRGNLSGTKQDLDLRSNNSVSTIVVFSVEFAVHKRNSTEKSAGVTGEEIGAEPPSFIPKQIESDEIVYLGSPSKWKLPKIGTLSMRSLYFVASVCLLVMLLLIIRVLVNRRRENREHSLVTKGDFEA